MTIPTVVDAENPSPTSILSLFGDGERRERAQGSPDPRDRRTVIKWSFASDPEARRSVVTRTLMDILLISSIVNGLILVYV